MAAATPESGPDPYAEAAAAGNLELVRRLEGNRKAAPAPPGAAGARYNVNAALIAAAKGGHLAVVEYLCGLPEGRGVDPSADDNAAIQCAAKNGHLAVVQYLCGLPGGRGVDPSANDNHAIQLAATYGQLAVVEYLCGLPEARGVDPSAKDNYAIRWAAANGH